MTAYRFGPHACSRHVASCSACQAQSACRSATCPKKVSHVGKCHNHVLHHDHAVQSKGKKSKAAKVTLNFDAERCPVDLSKFESQLKGIEDTLHAELSNIRTNDVTPGLSAVVTFCVGFLRRFCPLDRFMTSRSVAGWNHGGVGWRHVSSQQGSASQRQEQQHAACHDV